MQAYLDCPLPPAGLNHSYTGLASGKLRKNDAVTHWQDAIALLLKSAGLRELSRQEGTFTAVYWRITSNRLDVDAVAKALDDAVSMAAFGYHSDKIGRVIYWDAWQGFCAGSKRWKSSGRAEQVEVWVYVYDIHQDFYDDKWSFNLMSESFHQTMLHRMETLHKLREPGP